MAKKTKKSEKRKAQRLSYSYFIEYRKLNSPTVRKKARGVDIGGLGFGVCSDEPLPVNDRLHICIKDKKNIPPL